MKRAESIIIGKDGDLERREFHSLDVQDNRGKSTKSVFYRAQIVEGTILVQECQTEVVERKSKKEELETVTQQWAFHNRKAEIAFSADDPEEDEDSEGFDLLFGSGDVGDFDDE